MYSIVYAKEAKDRIERLDTRTKKQIKNAIERIVQNPEIGKHLLHELSSLFSYRSGNYRIIYRIYRKEIYILILTIGHRKDVYKLLKRRFWHKG